MNKRQTRTFFYASSGLFALIFLGMTVDTHRQIPKLTNEAALTPEVIQGKHVWHRKNCINCHTLLGEGAYFAPDLTKITQQRGAPYLEAFLKDPAKFYSEARDRRLMPNQNLTDGEIRQVIAFLDWVGHIDTQGWPPRPILVSGSAIPGAAAMGEAAPTAASSDPVAQGQALFRQTPPGCFACHSTAAGVNLVGPSLAGIGAAAAQRVKDPAYHGKATDAAGYIRESIRDPNAFVLTGPTYSSGGRSLMPTGFDASLTAEQVDHLTAYLMTLK
ncbi:MAG TPA: c-type cytochrome [Gemmatimonadales bacterium]|jgi:nitric oxide reductase subunit C|nr:c-type cytochrome [Gemmatimonadales bacterium]